MTQSRLSSFVEAWASTAIGFVVSCVLQEIVARIYHYQTSFLENLQVVLIFTVASVIRSYYVRRYFNHRLHTKKENKDAK